MKNASFFSPIDDSVEDELDELFGKCEGSGRDSCQCRACDPPDDEFRIICSGLPHDEKVFQLRQLRASKQSTTRPFRQRITSEDRIRARGMGIRLD